MEDVEAAFYEAWEDAGLADEAAPRAKGSRPSSQNKRKVRLTRFHTPISWCNSLQHVRGFLTRLAIKAPLLLSSAPAHARQSAS